MLTPFLAASRLRERVPWPVSAQQGPINPPPAELEAAEPASLPAVRLSYILSTLPPDEGLALQVLVAAGTLADEHHPRVGVAHAEDQVRARGAQRAELAVAHEVANLLQRDLARALVLVAGYVHDGHEVQPPSLRGALAARGRPLTCRSSQVSSQSRRRPRS